jgi:predicted DNA-binding antitoxin AbrB/MazE fold protein
MTTIEAVFRHGVFEPLEPVNFQEEQRVKLNVEPRGAFDMESWLGGVKRLHARILDRSGLLPDSAPDIAADRLR